MYEGGSPGNNAAIRKHHAELTEDEVETRIVEWHILRVRRLEEYEL